MNQEYSAAALASLAQGKAFTDLAGRVVFITGAASGIGLAMAHAFAQSGARLALLDINPATLEAAAESLRAAVPAVELRAWTAAVNDQAAVERAVDEACGHWGRVDVLLNNAGVSMNCPTLELSGEQWRQTIDININGVFYCAQAAGRRMTAQGCGVIINTASMYGLIAAPNRAAYCASKAAVAMLTRVLAVEWAEAGIRVNAIAPGYVQTSLVDELVEQGRMDLPALVHRTPAGRLGSPEEIAALALFMASAHAAFMNGHVVVVDGGWSAYGYL